MGELTMDVSTLDGVATHSVSEFPFECELSLRPLIEFWERGIADEASLRGRVGRVLRAELDRAPELFRRIDNLDVLAQHADLVEMLMAAIFPAASRLSEPAAALIPFQIKSFYSTPAFRRSLMGKTADSAGGSTSTRGRSATSGS
jgi:hypothetical protein